MPTREELSEALPLSHDEALELAYAKRHASNMARCLIDVLEKVNASPCADAIFAQLNAPDEVRRLINLPKQP